MNPSTAVSIDELLKHADWVRALSRRRVRDEARADDAVQETWSRPCATRREAPRTCAGGYPPSRAERS